MKPENPGAENLFKGYGEKCPQKFNEPSMEWSRGRRVRLPSENSVLPPEKGVGVLEAKANVAVFRSHRLEDGMVDFEGLRLSLFGCWKGYRAEDSGSGTLARVLLTTRMSHGRF